MTDTPITPRPAKTLAELHALLARIAGMEGQAERAAAIRAEIARLGG